MPKSLVLGNGNLLIGLDKYAQVSDFYFPHVGLEEQIGAHQVHKIGVWVNDQFSWLSDGSWEIKIDYVFESLISTISAFNHNLGIKLEFKDAVYNETDVFLREVTVFNLAGEKRLIKLFFHQSFEIYESKRGDTAYFYPPKHVLIHYKGKRVFLINAVSELESFDDFSIGNYSIEGKEGTFKDAEDGKLSQNPVEHGLVDSVIGFSLSLEGQSNQKFYYWITAGRFIKEALQLNDYVIGKTPQHLLKTTEDFWRAWVNKQDFCFCNLDENLVTQFKKSLFIIRSHVDNKGAIIASCDSDMLQHGKDNYSYVWPRDGALVAAALDKASDSSVARSFFEFCNDTITDEGYFLHKYLADQSLGSSWHSWVRDGQLELPIQEDETALVLIALKQHFDLSKDLEFIERVYNSMIKKAADFMVNFRDEQTSLPKPSYDLWEEKFGVHTFTAATVFAALNAAADFANLLGKTEEAQRYLGIATKIREGILEYLYDAKEGYFYKMINFKNNEKHIDRTVDCSSAYGIFKFGVLDIADERLVKSFAVTEDRLSMKNSVEGIARYEGDTYYGVGGDALGNPWFITSLWLAQYKIAKSSGLDDLEEGKKWLNWSFKNSLPSGVMSEQLNPYSGEPLSAAPLAWSHAEFVSTIFLFLEKIKALGACPKP